MPTLNDVLAGSQAQAVQVQQIIDALKGTPNKGVPVALVSLNDPNNYALTVQNDDPVNSRALSVLKADGTTLISADATGVTLGAPVNVPPGSISGSAIAAGSISNSMLGADVARANQLVNSGLEIWSRGTGPFPGNATYTADRWFMSFTVPSSLSVSRETVTVDTAFGSKTALKSVYVHSGAGSGYVQQQLKPADGSQLNSRVVTGSIRVNCNTSGAVRLQIAADGTGAPIAYSTFNGTTNAWVTLQATITVPPDATVVAVTVQLGDASLSSTTYVDNAMLVVGSQAANYVPMHPADDLARCLRYYEVMGLGGGFLAGAWAGAAGEAIASPIRWQVPKPVTPTVTKVGTWTVTNCAQPTLLTSTSDGSQLYAASTAIGHVQYVTTGSAYLSSEANP
jgi:hypothetical protein